VGLQVVRSDERAPRKMLAAVYSRVSTLGLGQDPNMQTRELVEYCERRGWEVYGCYTDEGVSGKKDSRPQLNRLMADAHARRFASSSCGASTASHGRCHTCVGH
jgi:hypothetical protein